MEKQKKSLELEIPIVEGVEVSVENNVFKFKGAKGENSRRLFNPSVNINVEAGKITLKPRLNKTKRENKLIKTFASHFINLMKGVKEGHLYKLKICSGHFPMNVAISNNEFIVKNFIGEKIPRKLPITQGTTVKLEGVDVIVEGTDKEATSQMAASIEQLTRRPGFDTRIFQDGIYLVNKDGKEIKHN